ncbi:MAG: hypothetical protein DCC51_13810 [Anaerolineae bacterium]|nr:MAG: hypothetical protein DCC51_13810 [Anaerolineae bacterium]
MHTLLASSLRIWALTRATFIAFVILMVFWCQGGVGTRSDVSAMPLSTSPIVESDHPYANDEDKVWVIENNSGLIAARIHFSRLNLEDGVDKIELFDEADTLIQVISASAPDGMWSENVPGSLVKIRLTTDGADVEWGFAIDQMEPTEYATIAYSSHPYAANAQEYTTLINDTPNPPGSRVHFSRIELEHQVDYLVIMDADNNAYQWITGNYIDGFTSKSVPGPVIKILLLSDSSGQDWGYNIVRVESGTPEAPEPPPSFSTTLAQSEHPYPLYETREWTIVNPDVEAVSSKVHFSRIDIDGWDSLQIFDADETLIQTFGEGTHLMDVWSDYVPGRIVKVRLSSNVAGNGTQGSDWGFLIDSIKNSVAKPGLAQSNHPYPAAETKEWTIVNPDVEAVSSKVHFSRIDIDGWDLIQIVDAEGTIIQTFGEGTHLRDVWSDYLPGRLIKVRLVSNIAGNGLYGSDWGFRVDDIKNSVAKPGLAQSNHPYPAKETKEWTIVNPDVEAMSSKIHFSRIDIGGWDLIQIADAGGTIVQTFGSDTHLRDVWSDYVPGRIVKVRLISDIAGNGLYGSDWGFRADDIRSISEEPIAYLPMIFK